MRSLPEGFEFPFKKITPKLLFNPTDVKHDVSHMK
jgi:hypothetical protein